MHCISHVYSFQQIPAPAGERAVALRVFGFLALVAALGVSGSVFVGKARSGGLNPVREVDEAGAPGELASAQYVLGIVAGQLAQVYVLRRRTRSSSKAPAAPSAKAGADFVSDRHKLG